MALIIGVIFVLFKSVEDHIAKAPEIEVEQSTQIGSGAASLKMNHPHIENKTEELAEVSDIQPTAAKARATSEEGEEESAPAAATVAAKKAEAPVEKFEQVTATFTLGEHGGLEEAGNKNWFLISQAAPINSSATEEMILKNGNNTFLFEDELITYDLNFFIEEITEKDVKVKLNIKRTLRARAQDGSQTNSFTLNEKIPLDQTLIIIDALPRRASIDRPNSILSTIYKSQSFISRATELVQIIKFENPSNSPQEELTP